MINYGNQHIDKADINSVKKVLNSNWLTQGPTVQKFEKKLKQFIGAKYSLVLNSGTAALHVACMCLNVKKNDIIIASPITFVSSVNSALFLGATPVFVDIDPKNYCIDLNKLEKKILELRSIGKKVKAAIITDYAGHVSDWKKIKFLSNKYNFFTINDNCHSLGSKYYKDKCYAVKFADIVTHSFHPVKVITTGEGGSLSTNNYNIYSKAKIFRTHGIIKNKQLNQKYGNWYYEMRELGFNYRMSDINAALGISQLNKINKFILKRREIANFYNKSFNDKLIFKIPYVERYCYHSYHLYPLQINFENLKINKKTFFKKLKKEGINLQVHYIPIHFQKYYKKNYNFSKTNLSVSENYYGNTVSLPIFYGLKKKQCYLIVKKIKRFCK